MATYSPTSKDYFELNIDLWWSKCGKCILKNIFSSLYSWFVSDTAGDILTNGLEFFDNR